MEKLPTQESEHRAFELTAETAQNISDTFNLGPVSDVTRFREGMINDVFSLNGTYVVKVNTRHPDLPKLEKEASVYKILPKHDVPAPTVIALDETKSIINYSYLVMEQIAGHSLESVWRGLSAEVQADFARESGALLGRIHSVPVSEVRWRGQEQYAGLKQDIGIRVTVILDALAKSGVFEAQRMQKIKKFYQSNVLFDVDSAPSLLHGNYGPGNIIIEASSIKGIIDWEWASIGHSEEELAVVLHRVFKTDQQKEAFIKGYETSHSISSDFNERRLAYVLLYYLKVLPSVPSWTHRPDKQKAHMTEMESLLEQLGL